VSSAYASEPFGYTDWWPTALYLNNTKKPFTDIKVRQAMQMAMDQQRIIKDIFAGHASNPLYNKPYLGGSGRGMAGWGTREPQSDKNREKMMKGQP
jgi:ABC-type oligopeptide transport system substrate-binding subunit